MGHRRKGQVKQLKPIKRNWKQRQRKTWTYPHRTRINMSRRKEDVDIQTGYDDRQ